MSARSTAAAGLVGAASLALLLVVDLPLGRLALAVLACLVLPGLGWARKMRLGDRGDTLALALVLSGCATVAVGTGMALTRTWSVAGGLAVLGLVTLAGFVPARAWVEQLAAGLRRGTELGGDAAWADWQFDLQVRQRRAEREAREAAEVWGDWYSDVERRAEQAREREAAAARQATDQWVAWYQQTQLRAGRRPGDEHDRAAGENPHRTHEESLP